MTTKRNEYTDTVRDIKALIRKEEADAVKRQTLSDNVDKMVTQLERQRERLEHMAVLTERVKWLTWEVHLVAGAVVTEFVHFLAGKVL